jgi:phospho-N-acetylmuramoyl-pentapeptide-transferase
LAGFYKGERESAKKGFNFKKTVICGACFFILLFISVILQTSYFKYTRKKYGEGRRIFLMAPLHHHYQKKGLHEVKIVTRFWIIGIALAIFTILTLKIR